MRIKPVYGHVPTHPSPEACPDPNPTFTQTLDLTQGRVGTWLATKQGQFTSKAGALCNQRNTLLPGTIVRDWARTLHT